MERILNVVALCIFLAPVGLQAAQSGDDAPDFKDVLGYDPSPAYPNGRPNPAAPEELSQFAFFIGEFNCNDRQRTANGDWREFSAIWNASYFLNGFGIQDKYYAPGFQTSNVRIYNPNTKTWNVTFFSAPGYNSGVWSGTKTGAGIVLEQTTATKDGSAAISRLTFFDITDDSFEWHAESISDGEPVTKSWTSSCKRRTH